MSLSRGQFSFGSGTVPKKMSGLNFWKDNNQDIILDADNLFWAINSSSEKEKGFISGDAISLYEKLKSKLDKEIYDFRFSKELTAIYIDPTDKCNSNCPYCYIPAKIRKDGRSMTGEELDFILKKLARYFKNRRDKQVIIFHASEPLLVKEILFPAIAQFSRVFKFGLQTNALLLKKSDVEFLKKYRVGVGISLDASFASLNNRLRPALGASGNFERAVKAIDWFKGYAGLNVIATVTKFNVKNLPKIVEFLHSKGVPCVLLNPLRFTLAPSRKLKPDIKLLTKYFIRAVDLAIKLSASSRHKIIIGNFTNVLLAIISPRARRLMCDISPCGAGRCFFTITAKGEMIPCGEFISLKNFSGGNIFKDTIRQAMQSEAFRRVRKRIVEDIPECRSCEFRNICGAPCPAELHSLGNMYQPSLFCDFYKTIIKYAFKLIGERKEKYTLRSEALNNLKYSYIL